MKQHILVVDDEAPIRDLLADFFGKHGFRITTASSSEETRRLADTLGLDLIILDIALADADGLDLLVALKAAHPSLPVIMLSGMGLDDQLLEESRLKGASGYASKMTPLPQLLTEVNRVLGREV